MMYDQPFTAYKRTRPETEEEMRKRLDDVVERWKKRKEERKKRGWSIHQFLATGEKKPLDEKS